MSARITGREVELTALLIAPNRELSEHFHRTVPYTRGFQILAEMKAYPSEQTLDMRLRQLNPDVVLLDVATDLSAAEEVIRAVSAVRPPVYVIGLHVRNDPEALVRSLRVGATEFLFEPFDVKTQREAISRIHRLRAPEDRPEVDWGKVVAFSSSKPGSGASTLASQCAFALRRQGAKRVLLADFDLAGGTTAVTLRAGQAHSLLDVLRHTERMDAALWEALTLHCGGIDILASPETPAVQTVDAARLHEVLDCAKLFYDWVVVDLPAVFCRISLQTLPECDAACLVSTTELPSLHLTRKAVGLLLQLGFEKDRFHVVLNRVRKGDSLGKGDLEKMFNSPVYASLPQDFQTLHRLAAEGRAVEPATEIGKAIDALAARLAGTNGEGRKKTEAALCQT